MALGLHPACLERLKGRLIECLPDFRLIGGTIIDKLSLDRLVNIDNSLPDHADLAETLRAYIGDAPFSEFVFGELSKELRDSQAFDSDAAAARLIDLPAYNDVAAVAQRLLASFEALPRKYRITYKLNGNL